MVSRRRIFAHLSTPHSLPPRRLACLRNTLKSSLKAALAASPALVDLPLPSSRIRFCSSSKRTGLGRQRACSSCLRERSGRSNTSPGPCPRDHAAVPPCLCPTLHFLHCRTVDTTERKRCLTERAEGRGVGRSCLRPRSTVPLRRTARTGCRHTRNSIRPPRLVGPLFARSYI
jgi:hypothetical protein